MNAASPTGAEHVRFQPTDARSPFAELHPRLSPGEAAAEASRCLYCFDAPCTRACPTQIDVPRFIRQILHDDAVGAAETILQANIFGGACARACPTEVLCEGACVDNTLLNAPIRIGRLQRYACDAAVGAKAALFQAGPDTGKRVAIIGAGPAGLTCAHELRKRGHAVTLFEARDQPGGLNTYGIARYKFDAAFALSEIQQLTAIGGIDLRLASPVDGPVLAGLIGEYDAVFLGVGLGKTAPLGIEGENLPGVWDALDFIARTRTRAADACGCSGRVVVIGGGNTAVDAATAAARLGATSVTIAYRRTAEEMPAFAYEYALTKAHDIIWQFAATPVRIVGRDGKACAVEFTRTRLIGAGRTARVEVIPGSNFVMPADMVIKALGQETLAGLLGGIAGLALDRGRVAVDPATGRTSIDKLFAGGDCVNGGAEIVDAVQAGKIAAAGIHSLFSP
jgi:glutamate synthase (NADPH/NADH) small chain